MKLYFKDIQLGHVFCCNGNLCKKRSSRTAELLEYGRWFYFDQYEIVEKDCTKNQELQSIGSLLETKEQ